MKKTLAILTLSTSMTAITTISGALAAASEEVPVYKNPAVSVDQRVEDLLSRMTLEEKVAQLVSLWSAKNMLLDENGTFAAELGAKTIPHGVGQIARPSDNFGRGETGQTITKTPRETVELVNAIQRYLVEETRLGIPATMHEEGLHGFAARGATHFPQAIGLASTWDPELVEEVYSVVAREMRVRGATQALTPVVDVARDPRWGRIEETYGEDPHLVAEMGVASVRGFQGPTLPLPEGKVFATLKHMTGHGEPESGTNVGPANISERILREVFFPPFERAVKEAGAMAVMASYNEIDGMPSHANEWLITDVLRGEWGFEGVVNADYEGVRQLEQRHHVAASPESAAAQALAAGVDIELPDPVAYPKLVELVQEGKVDEALVDRAVRRNLRQKFLAGLFENPYADADAAERLTSNEEAHALALRTAEKALILLKNEDGILPLDLGSLEKIAVIGPNASETLLGGYSDVPARTVSLVDGIRARVGDAAEVTFAQGVVITESRNWFADEVNLGNPETNRQLIAEAVEIAKASDIVIVAVGGNEQTSREAWLESHLGDRTSLDLVGEQDELVRAIVDTGTPTVVVLIHGRPLAVTEIAETVPAILDAWYPGQEGGTAMAHALFGDINPGGKLPVTVPRSVGQLPVFYNAKPTARRGYLFDTTDPLWPFGFGLSYSTFAFENLSLDRTEMGATDSATVSVDVANTGERTGDEVVQFYIRDVVSSVTRPIKELKGFARVTLAPGERKTVTFSVGPEQLRFYNRNMERVVEPGDFELMVGSSSADTTSITLTVVPGLQDAS